LSLKLQNNACRNLKTLKEVLKKEIGRQKKTTCCSSGWRSKAQANGRSAQNRYKEDAENNAEKDGSIFSTHISKKATGQPRNSSRFSCSSENVIHLGP
jgi:hypothetical protein